jgi:hypothetical protein
MGEANQVAAQSYCYFHADVDCEVYTFFRDIKTKLSVFYRPLVAYESALMLRRNFYSTLAFSPNSDASRFPALNATFESHYRFVPRWRT